MTDHTYSWAQMCLLNVSLPEKKRILKLNGWLNGKWMVPWDLFHQKICLRMDKNMVDIPATPGSCEVI